METETMGRVLTEALIENLEDCGRSSKAGYWPEKVRRTQIPDALVDTGATMLSLPTRLIRELGLSQRYKKRVTSSTWTGQASIYEPSA
jgi:hypothetical protein